MPGFVPSISGGSSSFELHLLLVLADYALVMVDKASLFRQLADLFRRWRRE
jgi:hypothetical protein